MYPGKGLAVYEKSFNCVEERIDSCSSFDWCCLSDLVSDEQRGSCMFYMLDAV